MVAPVVDPLGPRDESALPVSRTDPWYDPLTQVRDLGETDLTLALGLGRELGVDLPLAEAALDRLACGLGVPRGT